MKPSAVYEASLCMFELRFGDNDLTYSMRFDLSLQTYSMRFDLSLQNFKKS